MTKPIHVPKRTNEVYYFGKVGEGAEWCMRLMQRLRLNLLPSESPDHDDREQPTIYMLDSITYEHPLVVVRGWCTDDSEVPFVPDQWESLTHDFLMVEGSSADRAWRYVNNNDKQIWQGHFHPLSDKAFEMPKGSTAVESSYFRQVGSMLRCRHRDKLDLMAFHDLPKSALDRARRRQELQVRVKEAEFRQRVVVEA